MVRDRSRKARALKNSIRPEAGSGKMSSLRASALNRLVNTLFMFLLGFWLGAFTFYSGFIIPILHDEFGSLMGSMVTRRATWWLNAIALGGVAVGWSLVFLTRKSHLRFNRLKLSLLLGASGCVFILLVLHSKMMVYLETVGLEGFYGWHRAYLLVSTVQWLLNFVLFVEPLLTQKLPLDSPDGGAKPVALETDRFEQRN